MTVGRCNPICDQNTRGPVDCCHWLLHPTSALPVYARLCDSQVCAVWWVVRMLVTCCDDTVWLSGVHSWLHTWARNTV